MIVRKGWISISIILLVILCKVVIGQVDVWIRTGPNDNGSVPAIAPHEAAPDIAIDSPDNGWQLPSPFVLHESAIYGQPNRIYVRVRNLGVNDALNVTVKMYWADHTSGLPWPSAWNFIGQKTVSLISAGGEAIISNITWSPPGIAVRYPCLLAVAECAVDPVSTYSPKDDNNIAQRNITVLPPPPTRPRFSTSIHSGVAIPTGSFADDFGRGWNVLVDGEYHITPQLSLAAFVGYNRFDSKVAGVDDTYWFNGSLNLRFSQPISMYWSGYIGFGPGVYIPEVGDRELGGNAGLGCDFNRFFPFVFELGADYHWIFDPDIQFVHVHAGVLRRF